MQVFRFDQLDSTNDEARRLLASGGLGGLAAVVAREQTAGKGTRGRSWSSPRDAGLYLTVVDPSPPIAASSSPLCTLATGVACAEAIDAATGIRIALKPVNDLCADGRKLGGILTEGVVEDGRLAALLTGIGINVRRAPRDVEPGARPPVSLEDLLTPARLEAVNLDELVADLLERVASWHAAVADGRTQAVLDAWNGYREAGTELPVSFRRAFGAVPGGSRGVS